MVHPRPPNSTPTLSALVVLISLLALAPLGCVRLAATGGDDAQSISPDGASPDSGGLDQQLADKGASPDQRNDGSRDVTSPVDSSIDVSSARDSAPRVDVQSADLPSTPPDLNTGTPRATSQHDDCQSPLQIDLTTFANATVEFIVDTSGAGAHFSVGACSPFPDVVIAIRNAPSTRQVSCVSGTGNLTYGDTDYPACTKAITTNYAINCNGGSVIVPNPATDYVMVFCRDPALGPARIRFIGN